MDTSVTIVGNLTADPELRYTSSGLPLVSFTIASTPRVYDRQTGQWNDGETLFMRGSAWREHAVNIAGSLTKGTRVIAMGKLKQRSYETREGEKRTVIEMEVDEIGPSLRYATAKPVKAATPGAGMAPDPWANAAPANSWEAPDQTPDSDEVPF